MKAWEILTEGDVPADLKRHGDSSLSNALHGGLSFPGISINKYFPVGSLSLSNKNIYLVAFYGMKPRPGVSTSKKGWMDDKNNITYDERIEITRGLKHSSNTAKVILNLSAKTVDRNSWGTDRSFTDYFKYYFKGYNEYLTAVMAKLDPEYFNTILDELQAELDAEKAATASEPSAQ